MMSTKRAGPYGRKRKKWYRPFLFLRCWRKRRFQYLEQVNTHEEPQKDDDGYDGDDRSELNDTAPTHHMINSPQGLYFNVQEPPTRRSYTEDDSIESMDSLMGGEEQEDETSEATERISNLHKDYVLMAHLNFLVESTQPQEVDLMYETMG